MTKNIYLITNNSNSCPDLRCCSFDEFIHFWNIDKNKIKESIISTNCWNNKVVKLMFFYRSNSEKQKQQQNNNKQQKSLSKQSTTKNLGGSLIRNQFSSPFIPLSFERQNQNFLRENDLLPLCWLSDSEIKELTQRTHYKIQKRISRRRSLTKANFPFGETNPRRAKVVEKYHHRVGVRRALSDYQILFMDPIKDVELNNIFNSSIPKYNNNNKRVSFSSSSQITASSSSSFIHSNNIKEINLNENKLIQNKQQIKSIKPILTRKNSVKINRNTCALTSFRRRIGTSTSVGNCYENKNNNYYSVIRPMDYDLFRAWRRGSKLSVDVAICPSSNLETGKSSQSEHKISLTNWALVLKRILADWIKRCKHSNNEAIVAVEEEIEKEINENNNTNI